MSQSVIKKLDLANDLKPFACGREPPDQLDSSIAQRARGLNLKGKAFQNKENHTLELRLFSGLQAHLSA